ncbi:tyrosine-protein phosphatase [Tuwongella immobilis]|uniref:Tyrosine specific protein phosphatases domain-containing protein n=1 Tax=Tuwongella immobilis TaxID=692036 RepID=A0A6C2YSJ7_9BACT|nr:tyrosine-protein phosphatase [Tuwongella immobilis]VIP04334.1 protein tyrosine serine phosphatase : Protein tyrosine/serine phosphatase OS=Afipia sp. 1NLS2 GN=AfiDRAFT_1559 PE=4 SV=1: Y_phosphatase3 [Tuwongella immobilis]VTS06030.1 protein tyrosine serine phosphatase : Protein tyrosine/serine phosphatase OS=Afipia sp. 1NLS2 GN=AfiDRAFT_1559 PE=4 SV=1: Y_phosphatase3 [Tuwongella immobilis]
MQTKIPFSIRATVERVPMSLRRVGRVLVVVVFAFLVAELLRVVAFRNWHSVIPDQVYRSAQLSESALQEVIATHQIRTVLNLRGFCGDFDWYRAEMRATNAAGVSHEDITLSASRLPPPGELRRLLEVLDRSEFPILMHCRRGADRTGLAAALTVLLFTDSTLEQGLAHCSMRFGHTGIGPAAAMDRFFELYQEYLTKLQVPHSPERLRTFIRSDYCPDDAKGDLEVETIASPIRVGQPWNLRVKATNRSIRDWRFQPGLATGVHALFQLIREDGSIAQRGIAGQFHRIVPPGESISLLLPIVPPEQPGQYALVVELIAADRTAFGQLGGAPLQLMVTVQP